MTCGYIKTENKIDIEKIKNTFMAIECLQEADKVEDALHLLQNMCTEILKFENSLK